MQSNESMLARLAPTAQSWLQGEDTHLYSFM